MPEMWKAVAKVAVSVLLLGWLAYQLDWGPVLETLRRVNPVLVVAAVATQLAVSLLLTMRWGLLLRSHNPSYTTSALLRPCFISIFFNNLLPSSTGGDLLRAFHIYRLEKKLALAVSPILTERVTGLAVMIGLAVSALPFFRIEHPLLSAIAAVLPWIFVGAVCGLFLVAMPHTYRPFHRFIERWSRFRPVSTILHIAEAAHGYLKRPRLVIGMVFYTVALQGLEVVVFWLLGAGVEASPDFVAYLLVVPLVLVASMLPITVGGLGVRETAAITLFTIVGMSRPDAAAVSLLFLLVLVVASLPGLYFFLTMRDHRKFLRQAEASGIVDP